MRAARGDFGTPGTDSPFRHRPPEESLALFRRMRAGEFADGTYEIALELQRVFGDEKLKILKRPGKLGLGSDFIFPVGASGVRAARSSRL